MKTQQQTRLSVPARKPRNPLVAACRMRQAGAHAAGAQRQQAGRELRLEIDRLRYSP